MDNDISWPSGEELLDRMAQAYVSCESYRDTGVVTRPFDEEDEWKSPRMTRFQTVYTRPDRFRFEFTRDDEPFEATRYVIWTSASQAYSWWTVKPQVRARESIAMAIAAATGVSSGSAHTIPRLLMPSLTDGWTLTEMIEPKLLGIEGIDGLDCYRIQGSHSMGDEVTVWVEDANYLIRQVEWTSRAHGTEATHYRPEINVSIPDADFEPGIDE